MQWPKILIFSGELKNKHTCFKFVGVSLPTRARSGNDLPLSRSLSLIIYPDVEIEDAVWSLNAMQYGQIITHDMSMIAGSTQARKYSQLVRNTIKTRRLFLL